MVLNKILAKFISKRRPANSISSKTFDERYNDTGAFEYDMTGFTIHYEDLTKRISWSEITRLNVYKVDQITSDSINMEIVYGDNAFTISEEFPGWYQFVLKTKAIFPAIPEDWDINIIQPAFATNYTTIYDKTKLAGSQSA